jgi:hypothetical protein
MAQITRAPAKISSFSQGSVAGIELRLQFEGFSSLVRQTINSHFVQLQRRIYHATHGSGTGG